VDRWTLAIQTTDLAYVESAYSENLVDDNFRVAGLEVV